MQYSQALTILLVFFSFALSGQDLLTLDDAIAAALENNHQIRIKRSVAEAEALQVDPALVGRALVGNLNASYEFGWSDAYVETLPMGPGENPPLELDGISNDIIIAPEVSIVLLDGKSGSYRLDQLSTRSEMAQLELRQTIEQTIAQVSSTYYQLAQQQTQLALSRDRIALSQDRLNRTEQDATYGTSSSLQELQISVDLKTDSAALRDLSLAYEQNRRSFNRLLGQASETNFRVDTALTLQTDLELSALEEHFRQQNTLLRLSEKGIRLAELDVALSEAANRPRLQAYGNVSYAYLQNDASFLVVNRAIGPNVGLRFSYPLFDGGARRIQQQTARMRQQQQMIVQADTEAELLKELYNAYAIYRNTFDQIRIEQSNLTIFERNLENTRNRYRLGTATNTEVRAAQLNLDAALNRLAAYRYSAKQAEIQLMFLAGDFVE